MEPSLPQPTQGARGGCGEQHPWGQLTAVPPPSRLLLLCTAPPCCVLQNPYPHMEKNTININK